jgi:hypothetical protein
VPLCKDCGWDLRRTISTSHGKAARLVRSVRFVAVSHLQSAIRKCVPTGWASGTSSFSSHSARNNPILTPPGGGLFD